MSVEKKEDKKREPKFYEAPESGTIRQKNDPSHPEGASKDDAKNAPSEAPESGTMREK